MAWLVLVVLAACVGIVGYAEASKLEKPLFGQPAWRCGIAGAVIGAVAAFVAAPVVIGALAAYAAYTEASQYAKQAREDFLGAAAYGWAIVAFVFGVLGAAFTSPLLWTGVCLIAALVGEVVLLTRERDALLAERQRRLAEASRRPAAPPASAAPAPDAVAQPSPPAAAPAPRPQTQAPQTQAPQTQAPQPQAPQTDTASVAELRELWASAVPASTDARPPARSRTALPSRPAPAPDAHPATQDFQPDLLPRRR